MDLRNKSPSVLQEFRQNTHVWGREAFASNFARGGMSSFIFAATPAESARAFWNMGSIEAGSKEHIQNLKRLQSLHGGTQNLNIAEAIKKAEKAGNAAKTISLRKLAGKGLGAGANAAFVAYSMYETEGNMTQKAKAGVAAGASFGGFFVGGKLGGVAGAGIGTAVGGPIGAAIGGAIGWLGGGLLGSMAAEGGTMKLFGATDNMVERERARRTLDWARDPRAFGTQKAYTMRQMSLQAMNRGMMNARSILGREAVMMHQ